MQKFWISLIHIYKSIISPYVGAQCRFYPSCSEYALLAIRNYGSWRGWMKIILRLMRCNPFTSGGVDFP